jgi:hypothetical protein
MWYWRHSTAISAPHPRRHERKRFVVRYGFVAGLVNPAAFNVGSLLRYPGVSMGTQQEPLGDKHLARPEDSRFPAVALAAKQQLT